VRLCQQSKTSETTVRIAEEISVLRGIVCSAARRAYEIGTLAPISESDRPRPVVDAVEHVTLEIATSARPRHRGRSLSGFSSPDDGLTLAEVESRGGLDGRKHVRCALDRALELRS
jgi:hypothetical protein